MGFYRLDLDKMTAHYGIPLKELKEMPYSRLEQMEAVMRQEETAGECSDNAENPAYRNLVLQYFVPVKMLRKWFTDDEIVAACAWTNVGTRQICSEIFVEKGQTYVSVNGVIYFADKMEFLRESVEYMPKYDRYGRLLAERERKPVNVYRAQARYQGLTHGNVILKLLYDRYPELKQFNFNAYEMYNGEDEDAYEIYPDNQIYVPLAKLMDGDVNGIIEQNRRYCQSYNNGIYTIASLEERLKSESVVHMFDIVKQIGEKNRGQ